jgi:Holliday junction resolvase RusA-like endonuclease
MIDLKILGHPVAQGRPRFARTAKGVRTYDPAKSKDWKQFIALRANVEGVKPYHAGVALKMNIIFCLARPASVPEKKRPYPTCKPDLDNFLKGALDGLKGIAWHDDSQVVEILVRKIYSETPCVHIQIEEV